MKHLIYISDSRLPSEKANGYQVMKMCEAFAGQGVRVTLLFPKRIQHVELLDHDDPFAFYGINPSFTLRPLRNIDTIMFAASLPLWLRRISMIQFVHFFTYAASVVRYCWQFRKRDDMMLYGRAEFPFLLLSFLKPLFRPHLCYEAHSFPSAHSEWLRKRIARTVDLLVVITDQLRKRFVSIGIHPNRILVAHDSVDLDAFRVSESIVQLRKRLAIPLDRYVVGYIGRFHTMGMEKGISTLLKAVAEVKKHHPKQSPFLLCVGGPLSMVQAYRLLWEPLGLKETDVRFVDRRPVTEVPQWIAACDVVTIPFPWNEHMAYFASPMKLFEYMAVGKPIVASALPALQEILTHNSNALLVEPDNSEAFANALISLMDNPSHAERLGQQAKKDVQRFSWGGRARTILLRTG